MAIGTPIATVMPEFADEIVAYVPADTDPALIAPGALARLHDSQTVACRGTGEVKRRGYGVVCCERFRMNASFATVVR